MPESLRDYWTRNGHERDADDFAQKVINEATTGDDLRDAAAFVAATGKIDRYGAKLRDKVFDRTRELLDGEMIEDLGAVVQNPDPFSEAGSLAEALRLLNP